MRIVFFGTSHGVPEPNRKCSSVLVEVGENRYFIDMGSQAIEQLINRNLPVESVKAVFITHMHGDHTNGLLSFIDLCDWKFRQAEPVFCLPGDVEATKNAIDGWIKCLGGTMRPYDFRRVEDGFVFDDGVVRVTAFRTCHCEFSYAYLVEAEGKRVLFSGDLSHEGPSKDFPMSVLEKTLDLAVCEAVHFRATAYAPLFLDNKNLKRLCFTHYSARSVASVVEAKKMFSQNMEVVIATDGTEISI